MLCITLVLGMHIGSVVNQKRSKYIFEHFFLARNLTFLINHIEPKKWTNFFAIFWFKKEHCGMLMHFLIQFQYYTLGFLKKVGKYMGLKSATRVGIVSTILCKLNGQRPKKNLCRDKNRC